MVRCVFLAVVLCCAGGLAQTTQPVASPWQQTVRQFAQALTAADKAKVMELLGDRAPIARFGIADSEPLERLLAHTAKTEMVSAHGYFHPALAMAADLAADLKDNKLVPEELKRRLIPADDEQMKRANATAVQWVAESLHTTNEQPVAIILLWCDENAATPSQLLFVLLKGEALANSQFKVMQVLYGDPVAPR